jgi:hypothetical protein
LLGILKEKEKKLSQGFKSNFKIKIIYQTKATFRIFSKGATCIDCVKAIA